VRLGDAAKKLTPLFSLRKKKNKKKIRKLPKAL